MPARIENEGIVSRAVSGDPEPYNDGSNNSQELPECLPSDRPAQINSSDRCLSSDTEKRLSRPGTNRGAPDLNYGRST